MAETIAGFIGSLLGALVITAILSRIAGALFKKKYSRMGAAIRAFWLSGMVIVVLILIIGESTIGDLILYVICLLIWLAYDLRRAKKAKD